MTPFLSIDCISVWANPLGQLLSYSRRLNSLLCFALLLGGICTEAQAVEIRALTQSDLNQSVNLEQQWDFIGPDLKQGTIHVPGPWESHFQKRLPVFGTGIYQLKLIMPAEMIGENLKLYTELIAGGNLRVYANDKLVGHNGTYLGSHSRLPNFLPFELKQRELHLKIVVSNFQLQWSGLVRPIWIGTPQAINQHINRRSINLNVVFGIFMFLSFFHFLLFTFYRQDKATLWFCLICLSASVYMEFFALHNLEYLIADIPLEWSIRGVRIGLYGIIPFVFWYAYSLANHLIPINLVRSISLVCGALAASVLLPARLHTSLINVWYLLAFISVTYNFYIILKHYKNRDLAPYLYSTLVFSLAILNDILNALGWLTTGFYARYGVIAFCITQSGFLAWRLQKNYKQVIDFQDKLQTINHSLEQKVDSRTQEIQQKNEQLNQLLSFKEEMVEMLVHDIKTPLNLLLDLPAQAANDASDANPKSIEMASQRVKNLLEQIMSLNKNEQPDLQLILNKHNLSHLSQRVIQVLQPWALSKEIQLTNLIPTDTWVKIDQLLIERVLHNVLDNSLKHSPIGGEIKLSGYAFGPMFILDILDNGPGMSEEVIHHALEKYQSFSQGETQRSSGLGLYFCEQVVLAHGGEINLSSGPMTGTLVRITLPLNPFTRALSFDFQTEQQLRLSPYMTDLRALKTYQVTQLRPVLNELKKIKDPLIQAWLQALNASIEDVNEASYRKLIDQVKPDSDR